MSSMPVGKLALPELAAMKSRGDKIVMVTAYDMPGARFAEDAGIDMILVGDTAAMVVLGHEGTTVPVTMDEMLFLTRTVARAVRRAGRGRRHAVRLVPGVRRGRGAERDPVREGGAGGRRQARRRGADAVARPRDRPGRDPGRRAHRAHPADLDDARRLQDPGQDGRRGAPSSLADAEALQEAGCFMLVLEAIPAPVADEITRRLSIPTIGIGAGPGCDGQVLVYHDLLGLDRGAPPPLRQALRESLA